MSGAGQNQPLWPQRGARSRGFLALLTAALLSMTLLAGALADQAWAQQEAQTTGQAGNQASAPESSGARAVQNPPASPNGSVPTATSTRLPQPEQLPAAAGPAPAGLAPAGVAPSTAPASGTAPAAPPASAPVPASAPGSATSDPARLSTEARDQALGAARQVFEREKVRLAEAETALARGNNTGAQFDDLRAQLAASASALQDALPPLTLRAAAAKALLDQLGPRPDEKKDGPETPEAASERQSRQRAYTEISDAVRIGNALLLQANQLQAATASARRSQFTHALFDRSWSILSPELWSFVAGAAPSNLKALNTIGAAWGASVRTRIADGRMLPFLLSLAAVALVLGGRRLLLRRLRARNLRDSAPGALRRALGGLVRVTSDTAAAILACWLFYLGLVGSNLSPASIDPVIRTILVVLAVLAFVRAMISVLLAPRAPQWRIMKLPDQTAAPAAKALMQGATVALTGKVLVELLAAIGGDRATATAINAVIAAILAVLLIHMLRKIRDNVACDEQSLGPYVPSDGVVSSVWRLGGWTGALIVLVATVTGFIPLATFIVDQTLWILALLGMLQLLLAVVDEGLAHAFADSSRMSIAMQTTVGLRKRGLQQFGVVLAGMIRITLIAMVVLLALAPFGIESTDFIGSIRNVFFGLHLAGINISPINLFYGIGLLVAGIILTRAFQSWLQQKYLPATNLDSGLRNSITTAAGYLGVFLAVAATLANFGLSLDKIAIVAGALSVGIGFGLQSIVNNFVSGLILLWDRSISVGDWIVVGAEQGHVKRISVRATEIQTFERASVIVPNSTLVSGTVKNWLRNNRTGRFSIIVNTGFQADPQVVANLLMDCARAHPDVHREPKTSVLFNSFTATAQEYELRCFTDVESMSRVKSDLNYRIFAALTEAGIYAPPKTALSEVRVLLPEEAQQALFGRVDRNAQPAEATDS